MTELAEPQTKRKWRSLSPAERQRLFMLYSESKEITDEVMREYGLDMKRASLESKLRVYGEIAANISLDTTIRKLMPSSTSKRYIDYVVVEWADYIVISDVEIPDHSTVTLIKALLLGMAKGIKKLIIAGDLVATDQQAMNEHINTLSVKEDTSYEEDIDLTNGVLAALGQWFDEIIVIEGNHDDRVARTTRSGVHLGMLIKGNNVQYSRYGYLWVKSPIDGEYTHICHPRQYSKNSIVLGRALYNACVFPETRQKPKRFMLAHTHQTQTGFSDDGLCEIFGLGTARDPERTKYINKNTSSHPKWKNNIVLVKDDFAYSYTDVSDWRGILGPLFDKITPELERDI